MPIAPDRLDKFMFMPGQLELVNDPNELKRIHKLTGFVPMSEEERAYVSEQWKSRWCDEADISTDLLRAKYARKKAVGQL